MTDWPALAAANNAAWCAAVCRTHGLRTHVTPDAWTSPVRTPPLHPDAVTLARTADPARVLARIDASAGCSVKDSFATLELTSSGFEVLFDAEWIVRLPQHPATAGGDLRWTVVREPGRFAAWADTRAASETNVLGVGLLREDGVTVLAGQHDGRTVAGAVLTRTAPVVGVTNFFAGGGDVTATWLGCVAHAHALFPEDALVAYASGTALALARRTGFQPVGRLRVWAKGGGGGTSAGAGRLPDP